MGCIIKINDESMYKDKKGDPYEVLAVLKHTVDQFLKGKDDDLKTLCNMIVKGFREHDHHTNKNCPKFEEPLSRFKMVETDEKAEYVYDVDLASRLISLDGKLLSDEEVNNIIMNSILD